MANQGIMHLAAKPGGKPYCGTRHAIMSTTVDRIGGWRVCAKCNVVRLRYEQRAATNPTVTPQE